LAAALPPVEARRLRETTLTHAMRTLAGLALLLTAPLGAQTLIVGNKGEDSVSFVDLATGREIAREETASMPHEVAISPDGRRAAVVAYGGQTIDLFDVATATRTERIDLGSNRRPHGLLWLKSGRLVATTEGSDTLTIVRVAQVGAGPRVTQIPIGQKGSHMVAVSADETRAYVVNMGSASVSVVDLVSGNKLRDVKVGIEPEGVAISPDGRRLWVTDRKGSAVHVFDTRNMRSLAQVPTGATPIRVAISPDGRYAVTSNYGAGTLTFIHTATLKPARTVKVSGNSGFHQVTILFSGDGRRIYVAETGIDRIAEVDVAAGKVLGRLPAGRNGDGLGISPVTTRRN
ncbi:MAG TPA: cytochrome D1 domain-containing protein, partial [Sphingomonadaceae bacterium]|nr:cytochrome D1 domain-containing protein [Sphingomonadaceae bacterium]